MQSTVETEERKLAKFRNYSEIQKDSELVCYYLNCRNTL